MWHKIGYLLDYPENWCQFAIRVVLYPLFWLTIWSLLLWGLFLPLFFYFIMDDNDPVMVKIGVYIISGIMSGLLWYATHTELYKYNESYEKLIDKLVDKLPDCPKIDWRKSEFK